MPAQVPWPTQAYPDQGQPTQAGPAYHYPPPDPEPNYGYNQPVYAAQQWPQQDQQAGYDLASYHHPADAPPAFTQTAHHQQPYAETDDYGDEYYDDEPRRGRRWILIAAALVGAIGVGGALAYTYRSMIAPGGRVPLVRAESGIKAKPERRGDKELAGKDRTLSRETAALPPQPSSGADARKESSAGENAGVRIIKPIPVGPQQPRSVAPPSVPGITLDNVGPPPGTPAREAPAAAPSPPADRTALDRQPAAEVPQQADKEETKEADPPAPPPPPPPIRESAPQTSPSAVKTASLPRAAPSSGLGYVAVVASRNTRVDALMAYADAAEKLPEVLRDRTPDVQMADLGEKGIRYRAVVGPPGSREAARAICNRLKAAVPDCWVMEFKGS